MRSVTSTGTTALMPLARRCRSRCTLGVDVIDLPHVLHTLEHGGQLIADADVERRLAWHESRHRFHETAGIISRHRLHRLRAMLEPGSVGGDNVARILTTPTVLETDATYTQPFILRDPATRAWRLRRYGSNSFS